MLAVVATLKVKEGRNAEFEAAFREAMAGVRANEPENRLYQLVKSRTDGQVYRVMELYTSDAALEAHKANPHVQALGPKLKDFVVEKPTAEFYDAIV